jgi:hypothetical protein
MDQKRMDEQIAAEAPMPAPAIAADEQPRPMEAHMQRLRRRPIALRGIVEKGLVRPLDPHVKLPENAQVIIVATESV